MCCTAINNQMYIEPMLSAMFGMPKFNGADMAGIAFAVIGICAVLGSLVFPILIGSALPPFLTACELFGACLPWFTSWLI